MRVRVVLRRHWSRDGRHQEVGVVVHLGHRVLVLVLDHDDAFTPQHHGWDEVEQRALLNHRWWTVDELRATDETVYPSELAEVVSAVLDGTIEGTMELPSAEEY